MSTSLTSAEHRGVGERENRQCYYLFERPSEVRAESSEKQEQVGSMNTLCRRFVPRRTGEIYNHMCLQYDTGAYGYALSSFSLSVCSRETNKTTSDE